MEWMYCLCVYNFESWNIYMRLDISGLPRRVKSSYFSCAQRQTQLTLGKFQSDSAPSRDDRKCSMDLIGCLDIYQRHLLVTRAR